MTKIFLFVTLKLFKYKTFISFFLIIFTVSSYSENASNCFTYKLNNPYNGESILPHKISIKINNNKKFMVNNLKILTSDKIIKKKFKKRFSGQLKVFYNNRICNFKARIRIHGDFKDHLKMVKGNINQSLDIHLKEGNINGITKFKLLLPITRKNPDEEIIITEIFRSLNILAPKTFFINVDNQSNNYLALFQEKIEKEFLEFNNRKESVILEGDERYLFDNPEKNIDWESKLISLAKISNDELLKKSKFYKEILLNSLSNLNKFYLNEKNYKENFGIFYYEHTKLNDEPLLRSDFNNFKNKFAIFNSLIFATNSQHALNLHNRKFYWNKEYQTFEPIYYDGNIDINQNINEAELPKNEYFFKNILLTIGLLENLDQEILTKKILKNLNVIKKDQKKVTEKINQIKVNLDKINNLNVKKSKDNQPLQAKNHSKNVKDYFLRIDNKNVHAIFFDNSNKNFYECKITKCKLVQFSDDEIRQLINGSLKRENIHFQFIGISNIEDFELSLSDMSVDKNLKVINYQNSKIIFNKNEYLIEELKKDLINITQIVPNSRLIITGGTLENLKIVGNFISKEKNVNNKTFGIRGLTGCLNLIDLELNNVDIEILNGNCEDAINIIRSKGKVNSLSAFNSSNDAIDFDFSNIKISKLEILSAGNDCADLSYGKYDFDNVNISGCGDKALSVGEKSKLKIQDLIISNSNIGIASKDSSYVQLKNGNFNDLELCLSAYRKKQEFMGALIDAHKFNCVNYAKKIYKDDFSNIRLFN